MIDQAVSMDKKTDRLIEYIISNKNGKEARQIQATGNNGAGVKRSHTTMEQDDATN